MPEQRRDRDGLIPAEYRLLRLSDPSEGPSLELLEKLIGRLPEGSLKLEAEPSR